MAVDAETVRRVAHLARIAVAEDEVEHLKGELNAMLAFVEQLQEVDVTGVEPMTSAVHTPLPMRDDVVTEGGDRLRDGAQVQLPNAAPAPAAGAPAAGKPAAPGTPGTPGARRGKGRGKPPPSQ